jgi:class 3 adenylate cyclase
MTDRHSKNLAKPDKTIRFEKLVQDMVELGDLTVGRNVLEPGWRWSTHVRPHVGGEWCKGRHVGIVLSGRMGITFSDGSTMEVGPNEAFDIPPDHDGYTIGDEPCVQIEWGGLTAFTGRRNTARVLTTLLFTDIVSSTEMASRLGDAAWRGMLSSHFEMVRRELDRHLGHEVKTTGDGFLAIFEGPAHALGCAFAICRAAMADGLSIRAGVHVGEVERVGTDVRGIAVHEAQRIMAHAGNNEILVSELTRALSTASGYTFEDRGTHQLKGLSGDWHLYALANSP